ncbi:TauD/TfdA family dioxygenase [Lentzea sp. NPDC051213]|uniref:TauD/TfdA family dioxygenase n=1 Tax=Lentzea sp. NPDC051213 TaxID=3364126 RepID=UPI0037A6F80D
MNSRHLWRMQLVNGAAEQLLASADRSKAEGLGDYSPKPEVLTSSALQKFATDVRACLRSTQGFVVVEDFPVNHDAEITSRAYWHLGRALGEPVSQNSRGDLVGRVEQNHRSKNLRRRGYESSGALGFHSDRADVVTLLCVRSALSGGLTRLCSVRKIHDIMLHENPELLDELYRPLPVDLRGESFVGTADFCQMPVFSMMQGRLVGRYNRRFLETAQRYPLAPRLTDRQLLAMNALDEVMERPNVSLTASLSPGEVLVMNSFEVFHARSSYIDADINGGRLLLRLWLSSQDSPELPSSFKHIFGSTKAGTYRGGIWPGGQLPVGFGRLL